MDSFIYKLRLETPDTDSIEGLDSIDSNQNGSESDLQLICAELSKLTKNDLIDI